MTDFNVILFDGFESLDVFGPVEVIGKMPDNYNIKYYSYSGGLVTSSQKAIISTLPFSEIEKTGILFIPGGMGTRKLVNDSDFLQSIKSISEKSIYVLAVCTGSAILAKTNLLDNKNATTNKLSFNWVISNGEKVIWNKNARWVNDGKYYTSGGVSAGIDMTLGFINDVHGLEVTEKIINSIEYYWNKDKTKDKFSNLIVNQ